MGIVLEELKSDLMPINPTIMRVMRVLRIARGMYVSNLLGVSFYIGTGVPKVLERVLHKLRRAWTILKNAKSLKIIILVNHL